MACEQKNNPPSASFTHTSNSYETGDTIRFTSTSLMADAFEWDFGDGDTSTMENPWHIYNSPDDYPVTLKVTNTDGAHEITENILVKSPTILGFVAYDSAFEKTIPLTEIWLYETRGDWYNMENEAYYGQTDPVLQC